MICTSLDCPWTLLAIGAFAASGVASVGFSALTAAFLDSNLGLALLRTFADWGDKRSFKGKTVWVTGASSGIGAACAREFARRGARVVLSARRMHELELVKASCTPASNGKEHLVVALDLLNTASHPSIVADVFSKVGNVDLLVNNAGRSQRSLAEMTDLSTYPKNART